MRFWFRKSRQARNRVVKQNSSRQSPGELSICTENRGYNPYDTLGGLSREQLGMRRRDDGKWSF